MNPWQHAPFCNCYLVQLERQLGCIDRQIDALTTHGALLYGIPTAGRRVTRITETMDTAYRSPFEGNATLCAQTLRLGLDVITQSVFNTRSTKIIATVSPAVKSTQEVLELLNSGANVLRLDAAHDQNLVGCHRTGRRLVGWCCGPTTFCCVP